LRAARSAFPTLGLVPTMGFLHEGHLSLVRRARADCGAVAVSIFVNPTQFGPNEDFTRYPRDFERDCNLAEEVGVNVIFSPSNEEMYPDNYQTYVTVEGVTENLCGLSRPGHFRGVATICAKLFNMVKPHVTIFGQKDFQQLTVIKRMVQDLNMDLDVVGMPTTREADGLAMSSRNTYLSNEERSSALSLSRSLMMAKASYDGGERDALKIIGSACAFIERHPHAVIDYVKICDTATMQDADRLDGPCVMALAVKVGKTRLIDNYVFGDLLDI